METSGLLKKIIPTLILAAAVLAIITLMWLAHHYISNYVETFFGTGDAQMGASVLSLFEVAYRIIKILLWMTLVVAIIRLLNTVIFSTVLISASYEISTLLKNVLSTIFFIVAFIIILQSQFSTAYEKLAPIFTGSTIIGIVIGLALQDTLGNFFAGAAIQADEF